MRLAGSLARGAMLWSVCLLVACGSDPPIKPVALKDFAQTVRAKKRWTNDVRAAKTYNITPASAGGDVFAADTKGRIMRIDGA
ncbi:MAG: hypothetical protein ACKVQA_07530, partial [Burkholderiales bacterium]